MRISLEEIEEAPVRKRFRCEVSSLDLPANGSPFGGTVSVEVLLMRSREGISAKGEISFVAQLVCSRCANSFHRSFQEHIDLSYKRGEPKLEEGEVHLTEEETRTVFYDGDFIDLTGPVRDTMLLAVPIKPLCRDDCKGLCRLCGKDLNEGPCGCKEEETDPRWRKLADLKKQ